MFVLITCSTFLILPLVFWWFNRVEETELTRRRLEEKSHLKSLSSEEKINYARAYQQTPQYQNNNDDLTTVEIFQELWEDYLENNDVEPIKFEKTVKMFND